MNMILLTGLSVALALSIMSSNNFYADKVTASSIKDAHKQVELAMPDILKKDVLNNKRCDMPMPMPGMKLPGC